MKKLVGLFLVVFALTLSATAQVAGDFRSLAGGTGLWNDFNAWERFDGTSWLAATAGQLPLSTSDVEIQATHTMTVNAAALLCKNLLVNGSLDYSATTASALTVNGSVTVPAGGSFTSPASGTLVTHTLNIGGSTATGVGGDLLVNGLFDMNVFSTAGVAVNFYGSASNSVSGAGSINFYRINVNKGASNYNSILDVMSLITVPDATASVTSRITVTVGTFKLSSASTLNAFYGTTQPTQPNYARFWMDNAGAVVQSVGAGTVGGSTGTLSFGGMLQITAGTMAYGNSSSSFISIFGHFTMDGPSATLNVYGKISSGSASIFTITAGNINLYPQLGANYVPAGYFSQTGIFQFGGSSLTFTGGTVTVFDPTLAVSSGMYYAPYMIYITGGTNNLAGSTIRFGDGISDLDGGANGFTLSSVSTLGNVIVNSSPTSTLTSRAVKMMRATAIGGNLTINSGTANQFLLNGFALTMGGNISNAGTLVTDGAAGNGLVFSGAAQQTIGGAGTFSDNVNNLTINNTSGLTPAVDLQIPLSVSNSLTLTNGSLGTSNGSVFTMGKSASSTTLNITRSGGSLALTPVLALTGVTLNAVTYSAPVPAAAVTTGAELPAATPVTTLTVSNASGVTLDKPVSCTTLALTAGILTATAPNTITVTGSAPTNITGGSATAFVNGPLTRTLPSTAVAATYKFPIGKTLYDLFEFSSITTGGAGDATFTAEAFDSGPYAGTAGTGLSSLNTDKYWALSANLGSVTIGSSSVRFTESGLTATNRVAQSNTADGTFNSRGGVLGTGTIASVDALDYSAVATGTFFKIGSASALGAGTYAIGPQASYAGYAGTFASMGSAVAAITGVPLPGAVIFEFQNDYSPAVETFPVALTAGIASNATATVTFRPAADVAAVINLSAATAIINNSGADYVTFDGRNGGAGTNKFLQFTNTSVTGAVVSLTGDATFNQLLYCVFKGLNTSTTSGLLFIGTPGAGGNSNYVVDNCNFDASASAHNGLYQSGLGANAAITNNSFFDYRNGAGLYLVNGSDNAIIDNNSFYQTLAYNGFAGTTYGIRVTGGNNCQISNNLIGGSGPALAGIWTVAATSPAAYNFTGIAASMGTTTASRIYNNKMQNFDWKSNASTWTGMNVGGLANVGTDGANYVGNETSTGNILITYYATGTAQVNGVLTAGAAVVENNFIGSITTALAAGVTATGCNFTGINSTGTGSVRNNIIGSATVPLSINMANQSTGTTAQNVYGYYSTGSTMIFTGNTIANMNNGSTIAYGATRGVMIPNYGSNLNISGNFIFSISTSQPVTGTGFTAASLNGINIQSNISSSTTVADNLIYDLVNTAAAAVCVNGIYYNGASSTAFKMERNYIHSFSTASNTAIQNGINLNYGGLTVQNNIIRLGTDKNGAAITSTAQINGLYKASSQTCNFYFNTVLIEGTGVVAGAVNTYALRIAAHSTEDARDNILFNARSGGGKNYAIIVPGTTPNPANLICDYNDLIVTGVGGVLGFYNNADQASLAAWQTATGLDINSQNQDPMFVSAADLHPSNAVMNDAGVTIAGITDDYARVTRGTPPDIGAYEFGATVPGVPVLVSPANGAVDVALTPTLVWNTVTGATTYNLLLATDAGFTNLIVNQTGLTATSYAVSTPLVNLTTYHWKVSATGAGGTGPFSTPWSFTTLNVAINDLRASVQTTNILLEWTDLPGATGYNVYRGTAYNFVPDVAGGTNRIGANVADQDGGTAGVQWTDTGNGAVIVGDVNNNYFYKATGLLGAESNPSNVAGEFDFNLITTASTDINELAVVLNTQNTRLPITTAEQLIQSVPNGTDVYYWDAAGQGTVGHTIGLPFNNFSVSAGYPYVVNVSANGVWTVAGAYSTPSFSLLTTAGTDVNHISVPLEKFALTTAELLGLDVTSCTDVYYWDAPSQGTVGHVVGLPFNNFAVNDGYPYYVSVSAGSTWPAAVPAPPVGEKQPLALAKMSGNSLVGRNVPHTVYGTLAAPKELDLTKSALKIRAWVEGRPQEIVTEERPGTGNDATYWWVAISDFPTGWKIGETLHVEITTADAGLGGTASVSLTGAGSDNAGEICLSQTTGLDAFAGQIPKELVLLHNYPNPFNATTMIRFGLPKDGQVTLQIFDILGRTVRTLLQEEMKAGYHQVSWDGNDDLKRGVGSGIYWCRFSEGSEHKTTKMMLIK